MKTDDYSPELKKVISFIEKVADCTDDGLIEKVIKITGYTFYENLKQGQIKKLLALEKQSKIN